jgi:hypothetical protein
VKLSLVYVLLANLSAATNYESQLDRLGPLEKMGLMEQMERMGRMEKTGSMERTDLTVPLAYLSVFCD